jgi:truncated hemoglobin YjbI
MEGFVKPNQVLFEGNVAENWRRFKQKFEIFVTGYDKKTNKEKCCMLLNLAGEQGD